MQDLRKQIYELADEKYKEFQGSLCPNVNDIIGVRIPNLRKLAKTIAKEEPITFLNTYKCEFYEEKMIYGLVIGYMKADLKTRIKYLDKFVPMIDNWAICDCCSATYKFASKNLKEIYEYILKYIKSDKEFEVRFAVIMLMDYFIIDEYIDRVFDIYNNIKLDKYYVKMGIAWGISEAFIKNEDKTLKFLKDNKLDKFTFNKSLQKIIESYRVDKKTKDYLRKMKK